MLTLEEIFVNHNNQGESVERVVLFEEEAWCIYERIPEGMDERFHLIHRCAVNVKAVFTGEYPHDYKGMTTPKCRGCNAVPSDDILGLLKLHKWGMGDDERYDY
jgi:hypothetical protein